MSFEISGSDAPWARMLPNYPRALCRGRDYTSGTHGGWAAGSALVRRITLPRRMNFLGHLLVSGNDPLVITGNFMADAVKGRDLSQHPDGIQRGIRLHRHIDTFTDQHAITLQGRERLRTHCGKFAGVALDIFYDHCIASTWAEKEPLPAFAQRMYTLLDAHHHLMPERTQRMLPYMMRGDWLTSYATLDGIADALAGLAHRVPHGSVLVGAERVLAAHRDAYVAECSAFLRDLRTHLSREEG
jgi:acyl carrier protein phosphodiesterase